MQTNTETSLTTLKPELYVASNRWQWRQNLLALERFQKSFKRDAQGEEQYLDLGCGTGDFTRECLLPRCLPCRRIVAVDVSKDMVEYARSHFAHPKIAYDVLGAAEDDVSGFVARYGRFDHVFSFFCLNWVKDQAKALKNIALLMKPGGSCLLLFVATTPLMRCRQELAFKTRWSKYAQICQDFVPPSHDLKGSEALESYMKDLLMTANLTPSACDVFHVEFDFPDLESLTRSHLAMSPMTTLVTEEERPLFLEDMKEQARKLWAIKEAGGSPFEFDIFVVFASSKDLP
ncbi:juvenile hormone acid O-methyltransferase-like [Ixodes scapularis]